MICILIRLISAAVVSYDRARFESERYKAASKQKNIKLRAETDQLGVRILYATRETRL